jgi:hypothetical protein
MTPKDFFNFIGMLESNRPFTPRGIESLLNARLGIDSQNDSRIYYVSTQIEPNRFGISISDIDLRIMKDDPSHRVLLSIEFPDAPVGPEDIRSHFPDASLVLPTAGPPPQGISPNASISYWITRDWGKISFGFKVSHPDRLARVTCHVGRSDE